MHIIGRTITYRQSILPFIVSRHQRSTDPLFEITFDRTRSHPCSLRSVDNRLRSACFRSLHQTRGRSHLHRRPLPFQFLSPSYTYGARRKVSPSKASTSKTSSSFLGPFFIYSTFFTMAFSSSRNTSLKPCFRNSDRDGLSMAISSYSSLMSFSFAIWQSICRPFLP